MPIYRFILLLAAPVIALRMALALLRGGESTDSLRERLALGRSRPQAVPRLWLHGASLGELTAAKGLIETVLKRSPDIAILVTCNTRTARKMVGGWGLDRLEVRLAPLDYPSVIKRFFRTWQPLACVTLENELWPVRLLNARRSGLPVIIIGGRMSARSARSWARIPGLAQRVMGAVTLLVPLDATNARRFADLGVAPARITEPLNLKSGVRLEAPDPQDLQRLRRTFPRDDTILAASTHPGEDEIVLTAFARARARRPALRLIIAPRHPDRAAAIARLVEKAGLTCLRRSANRENPSAADVYLADTTGEMPLFHSLAAITVMCGSFTDRGGHTPVEAVQFSSFVVHGPDVSNHTEAYAALHRAQAAVEAGDATELAAFLAEPPPPAVLQAQAQRAQDALAALRPRPPVFDDLVERFAALAAKTPPPGRQD